jgi:glycosyltransferase involved in cell wall biosynthesis
MTLMGWPMIGIVHGYGLGGSGSNLWTREAVSALCNIGHPVHLVCQEPNPDRYDFVTEFIVYDDAGKPERRFQRASDRPGPCTLHKPTLNVLPTYVRPDRPSDYVRSILDLDDAAIEEYLTRNVRVLRHVAAEHGVRSWHVNHVVLLTEALRRMKEDHGARYAVMPHGSALEYVVQHDDRMKEMARGVLAAADRIFSLNQEVRDRLARYFPDLGLEPKTVTVPVGTDTSRFGLIPRENRAQGVDRLAAALQGEERGRTDAHRPYLQAALEGATDHDTFRKLLAPASDYPAAPDADLEDRLRAVDWEHEPIIAFVGRLIPAKGVSALVAAFPLILRQHPRARLLLIGTGWLREYLDAFQMALANGDADRAFRLMTWTGERAQEGARPFATTFVQELRQSGHFDDYALNAQRHLTPDRILFTGFLEHHLLAHVFPLADVAVFPSAVAEASPLVIPEAAACGAFPMGTHFAGMRHSLDALAPCLPATLRPLMRIRPEPEHAVHDIARNVSGVLDHHADHGADYRTPLRAAAVDNYDWRSIARTMADQLESLAGP